ncbi:MAG: dTMP kinase [Fimbriimonas sp.]|nr:dTMP kinase [Fimbriimonas sp.]
MFITFEGPEGAGKSTVLLSIADRLRASGRDVVTTREPGAGELGKSIRQILLHGDDLDPKSELLLFLADRANHVSNIVRPALARGAIVLCDRYADSTLVYQAYARGLDEAFARAGNAFATGGLVPDLTLLVDLDPRIGLTRLQSKDRLDAQSIDFHERVRDGFLREAASDAKRWRVVDGSQTADLVLEACWQFIEPLVR